MTYRLITIWILSLSACASQTTPSVTSSASRSLPPGHPSLDEQPAAKAPVTTNSLPPGHPPIGVNLDDPGPNAEAWSRPYILLDGKTGQALSTLDLNQRVEKAQVVYVGEDHTSANHHFAQFEIIRIAAQFGEVAIGLEMIQIPFQAALDTFLATKDEAQFLKDSEWEKRWGFDFRLYRPILRWAAEHQHSLVALNAPRELTKAVAREGVENLDSDLADTLPELDLSNIRHKTRIRLVWQQHGAHHSPRTFDNFYSAQVLWDESMAESVHRYLTQKGVASRMVVLAGAGHVRYREGIPNRVRRRGLSNDLIIIPMDSGEAVELIGSGVADILWVFVSEKEVQGRTQS